MKKALLRITMILLVAVSMFTFIGCEYFIKPADTYEDETKYISEIRKTIENFFSYIEYDSAYIIVENYADLCVIYEYARVYAGKRPKES